MTAPEQMPARLLPCPFCGGDPLELAIEPHEHMFCKMPDHPGSHVIECTCGAGLIAATRDEVLAMWNRRADRDAVIEQCAQLYGQGDVEAPVGNSGWGEAYQQGWIAGTQAYRDAIRELINEE